MTYVVFHNIDLDFPELQEVKCQQGVCLKKHF